MRIPYARFQAIVLLTALVLCVSSTASAKLTKRKMQQASAKITAMKVSTVGPTPDGEMGTLDDIFEGKTGNAPVFAGTGAANYPTHYVMVMVEVTADTWYWDVELTGREGRRVVYRKIAKTYVPAGMPSIAPVKSYAYFFIEGDRCETIRLTARIVGQRRPSTMTKTVEFGCGE